LLFLWVGGSFSLRAVAHLFEMAAGDQQLLQQIVDNMVSKGDLTSMKAEIQQVVQDTVKASMDHICKKYDKKFEEQDKAIGDLRAMMETMKGACQ
jgi:polyhydroxyalkanoate synthesis regulator phasin